MKDRNRYLVTYRVSDDGPTSACFAVAAREKDVRAWFERRGDQVISVIAEEDAPSWMGEGKHYQTVNCPISEPETEKPYANDDERIADLERSLAHTQRRLERVMRKRMILSERLEDARRRIADYEENAMQAIDAALLWGENAGIACAERFQEDVRDDNPISKSMTIHLGARQSVTLSSDAAELLYKAYGQMNERGVGVAGPMGIYRFDLRKEGDELRKVL